MSGMMFHHTNRNNCWPYEQALNTSKDAPSLLIAVHTGHFGKVSRFLFHPFLGLKIEEECQSCLAGYYCSEAGLNTTSGVCAAGYYCPVGSKNAQQKDCPVGKYCPLQSEEPSLCPVGTYQPNERQDKIDDCLVCTEGE